MIGWRAKLGVLVPAVNFTMEPEMYMMAPEGVSVHYQRLPMSTRDRASSDLAEEAWEKGLRQLVEELPGAVETLATVGPDAIAFGCTSGSFLEGMGHDLEIIARIEDATGVPATTTSTSVVAALQEMGMERIAVGTPYPDNINARGREFLEANGFKVLTIEGMKNFTHISEIMSEQVYRFARRLDSSEADGIFISCTALHTIDILEMLEMDLEKPVVSSNQATMWNLLRMVGVGEPVVGCGELLTRL